MAAEERRGIGIIGAGTMGRGIAQIAATNGHRTVLIDSDSDILKKSQKQLEDTFAMLSAKGKMGADEAQKALERIAYSHDGFAAIDCSLIIEAIIEDLNTKLDVIRTMEPLVNKDCILATNTSSLSIMSLASVCEQPGRFLGIHFFNPVPLMPLVEIIPCLKTDQSTLDISESLIRNWGKTTVRAKDTPGFIVNRIARPFYGEALRIYEEGVADFATIDWAMREVGGFRMGPFELMDLIGIDINYHVSETVFQQMYYDPRYKPSILQKRMLEAGYLGRKTKKGYYSYEDNASNPEAQMDIALGEQIFARIIAMLINEAADALFLNIASKEDLDLAVTKGVNYPKGLLQWADELGVDKIYARLQELQEVYGEDRYRPSPLLRKMVQERRKFYMEKESFSE